MLTLLEWLGGQHKGQAAAARLSAEEGVLAQEQRLQTTRQKTYLGFLQALYKPLRRRLLLLGLIRRGEGA